VVMGVMSSAASVVLALLFAPAQSRMALASLRGQSPQLGDIFRFQRTGTFFFTSVAAAFIIGAAFLCFVVPGIIAALGLAFVAFFVVDGTEDLGIGAAIQSSWDRSRGHRLHLFGLVILVGIVDLILNALFHASRYLLPFKLALQLVETPIMTLGLGFIYTRITATVPVAPPALLPHEPTVIVSL
jgi:hypothetical protein